MTTVAPRKPQAEKLLTDRERLFVQEYTIDLCGTAAARRAGYAVANADVTSARLLRRARVKAAIETALSSGEERRIVTREWVVVEGLKQYRKADAAGKGLLAQRALDFLARLHGLMPEPERRVRIVRELGDLTEEELIAVAESYRGEDDGTRH